MRSLLALALVGALAVSSAAADADDIEVEAPVEVDAGFGGGAAGGEPIDEEDYAARQAAYMEAMAKMTPEQRAELEEQQAIVGALLQSPNLSNECRASLLESVRAGKDLGLSEECNNAVREEMGRIITERRGGAGAEGGAGAGAAPRRGAASDAVTAPDNLTVMGQLLLLVAGFVAVVLGYARMVSKKRKAAAAAAAGAAGGAKGKGAKKTN